MGEKENILSKFNIKDYRNNLELVLENKQFDEEAKSLLLSIFYKLDNFYKDYSLVKKECENKNKFIEEYIDIIKNKCNKIEILPPQKCTKTKKYIVDKSNGTIQSFPSENILLFAIYELNEQQLDEKLENLTNNCVINMMNKGKVINSTEPIRDFNGWSWNPEINDTKNIEYNLIFQNLLMLFDYNIINNNINNTNIINILKNRINNELSKEKSSELIECLLQVAIILYNNESLNNHNLCLEYKKSIIDKINILNNRKEYINTTTKNNSLMIKKIQKIDIILNDINLIRKEFEKRTKQNNEEYFCISDLVDKMEVERQELLQQMDNNNKLLSPKQYLKNHDEYKRSLNLYESIKEEQVKVNVNNKIIKLQKIFLECLKLKILKNENKKDLYIMATQLRYYANIPYKRNKSIIKQEKLEQEFEDVSKSLIIKMVENRIIDIGYKNKNLNYEILKYIFNTKITKLENIILKISINTKNEIQVEYYDGNMLDYKKSFEIPFDEEIINKKDRKIKLFKIGG